MSIIDLPTVHPDELASVVGGGGDFSLGDIGSSLLGNVMNGGLQSLASGQGFDGFLKSFAPRQNG